MPVARLASDNPPRIASMKKTDCLAAILIVGLRLQKCIGGGIRDGEKKSAADQKKCKLPDGSDFGGRHDEQAMNQSRSHGHVGTRAG